MTRLHTFVAIIAALSSLAVQTGSAAEFRPIFKGPTTVENFLHELFLVTHSSGSLILRGTCEATNVDNDVVSDALSHPPQGPFQDLGEALTAVSRLNPNLSWSNNSSDGLIRVRDDRVPNDVLRIRLRRVHFRGAVNPNEAISSVLSAPEVRAYFKKNHIEDGLVFIHLWGVGTKGLPGLSGDLRNATVEEALDRIVRFLPGLWVYSECDNGSIRRVMITGFEEAFPGTTPAGARVRQP